MIQNLDDVQKMSQTNVDSAMKVWGDWGKGWQAMTAEMTDYSKRSFEEGTRAFERMLAARSMEQAMEVQTSYAKRCYDDYMQQMSRLGSMYVDLAKDTAKPMERFTQAKR